MTVLAHPSASQQPVLDRPMPQSPDAERAVLGAILINNHAFYRVANLTAEHFSKDAHATIYRQMALMAEEGIAIEPLTLKEELARRGLLDSAGGFGFIASLLDVVPDVANVERYAAIVERMAKKRAGILAGYALAEQSFDPGTEPEEVAASAMAVLGAQATREDAQARPLYEVLTETCDAMASLRDRNASVSMTSGWNELDDHKVFVPTFAVTGAITKHGKSAWMMAIANGLAAHENPVAIFSLESSNRELALRHTSAMTGIPHSRVRDWRTFSDRDFERIAQCRKVTSKLPIWMTRNIRTAEEIVMEIRRLKMMHGVKAAFIDYVQLVDLKRRVDNREERLAEISKLFLETAIEQDIHVHALSQLRDGAGEEGKRLAVNDLAYAKAIGKSARIVMMFQRPGKANRESGTKSCVVNFQIEANNEGRTNDFEAHFDEITQSFAEGTCEQNDCRTLRGERPAQQRLV